MPGLGAKFRKHQLGKKEGEGAETSAPEPEPAAIPPGASATGPTPSAPPLPPSTGKPVDGQDGERRGDQQRARSNVRARSAEPATTASVASSEPSAPVDVDGIAERFGDAVDQMLERFGERLKEALLSVHEAKVRARQSATKAYSETEELRRVAGQVDRELRQLPAKKAKLARARAEHGQPDNFGWWTIVVAAVIAIAASFAGAAVGKEIYQHPSLDAAEWIGRFAFGGIAFGLVLIVSGLLRQKRSSKMKTAREPREAESQQQQRDAA